MPTTIPYDPGLVLGNIIEKEKLTQLESIATAQKPIDDAQDQLNSLILQKRSMDMTMQEMINMNVGSDDLKPLVTNIETLKKTLVSTAVKLSQAVITGEQKIAEIKNKAGQTKINEEIESPIDYNKSSIKKMPLSSDSMKMDTQYFRMESNDQAADSHANAIASYVSASVSDIFGYSAGGKAGASAKHMVTSQTQNHNIQGTLVITANCTHKQVDVFAPFILDVDKGIRAWNAYNSDDTIDMDSPASVAQIVSSKKATTEAGMSLLSGATYGSSFVGMVHILQEEGTSSSQSAETLATSVAGQMKIGGWFASEEGKFGVDSSFSNSVKNLLSTSNLQAHCSLLTMGLIPSIKANTVTTVVKGLMGDPKQHMEELASIQGATNSDLTTISSAASGAKEGQSLSTLSTDYMKAAVDAVGTMDEKANQVIDTNSLMTAFDDYVQKAIAGDCGIPINFFLKPITKIQLAKAWVNKYYPNQFQGANSGDDESKGGNPSDVKEG